MGIIRNEIQISSCILKIILQKDKLNVPDF